MKPKDRRKIMKIVRMMLSEADDVETIQFKDNKFFLEIIPKEEKK